MRFNVLWLFAAFCFATINSCNDNGVGPEIEPGRRDYVWTEDTLKVEKNDIMLISRIWGSSPTDIWAVGSADTYRHTIWHYDGIYWKADTISKFISPRGIYGFSKNNVWMGNTNNSFWKYNGSQWNEFSSHSLEDFDEIVNQSMHGINENEIYAVGFADKYDDSKLTRIVMKFDGVKWEFVDIPQLPERFIEVAVEKSTNNVFINANRDSSPQKPNFIYLLKGNQLTEIASSSETVSLGIIQDKVYQVMGQKIYKYNNDKLELFKDFSGTDYAGRIWGRSEKDFFTVNWNYTIGHYNGTDLKDIYQINYYVLNAVIFPQDVFFLCHDFDTGINLVLHGKLKE